MASHDHHHWTRRELLRTVIAGGLLAGSGLSFAEWMNRPQLHAQTFIGQAGTYTADIRSVIISGFRELGITPSEIKGKRILLKPNLVETHQGSSHINTLPLVVRGVIEAFLSFGAQRVMVGEGPGHRRDTLDVIETSGLAEVLYEDRIQFLNLNYESGKPIPNLGKKTRLKQLTFPGVFQSVDWIVSLAKFKTHHWTGATLSMKNLFGVMPGIYYGWPKTFCTRRISPTPFWISMRRYDPISPSWMASWAWRAMAPSWERPYILEFSSWVATFQRSMPPVRV